MISFSVNTETQFGLTWDLWKRRVAAVEDSRFTGLYISDHFVMRNRPDRDSLDSIVALTYLAVHSKRIKFGSMVAPLSFRDPVILARQAVALDDLSEGRMILGLGSGHIEREHTMFGYSLGDIPTRIRRFTEGLEVITRLLHSAEPQNFEGEHFHLRDALLATQPQRLGGPPILIGANQPKKMLPLVAKYADIWNGYLISAEEFREKSQKLDELLKAGPRPEHNVKRTVMLALVFDYPGANLENQISVLRQYNPSLAHLPLTDLLSEIGTWEGVLVGTSSELFDQIRAYVEAGAEEIMLDCMDLEDTRWFGVFTDEVISKFS